MTCNCPAYRFPHRHGGGSCNCPEPVTSSEKGNPPACCECQYSRTQRDPYGTGDHWFTLTDCRLDYCPWEAK